MKRIKEEYDELNAVYSLNEIKNSVDLKSIPKYTKKYLKNRFADKPICVHGCIVGGCVDCASYRMNIAYRNYCKSILNQNNADINNDKNTITKMETDNEPIKSVPEKDTYERNPLLGLLLLAESCDNAEKLNPLIPPISCPKYGLLIDDISITSIQENNEIPDDIIDILLKI